MNYLSPSTSYIPSEGMMRLTVHHGEGREKKKRKRTQGKRVEVSY